LNSLFANFVESKSRRL